MGGAFTGVRPITCPDTFTSGGSRISRGGGTNPRGGGGAKHVILPIFPKSCINIERIRTAGGVPRAPLDPPLFAIILENYNKLSVMSKSIVRITVLLVVTSVEHPW